MTERRNKPSRTAEARLLEDEEPLTLGELCQLCELHAEWVHEMVLEGFLEPLDPAASRWRFTPESVLRVRRALRLQQDLGLNLTGAALALELTDEIRALRRRLRLMEQMLDPYGE